MTKGPRRLVLDQYLDSAAPGVVRNAGRDWKDKADDLQELGEALRKAAAQAELRIGEQTLTGPALRAGMEESAVSMLAKSEQLRTAGEALRQVGQQLADTRDVRDALADLGEKPPPYQAPPGTPGVELTRTRSWPSRRPRRPAPTSAPPGRRSTTSRRPGPSP